MSKNEMEPGCIRIGQIGHVFWFISFDLLAADLPYGKDLTSMNRQIYCYYQLRVEHKNT